MRAALLVVALAACTEARVGDTPGVDAGEDVDAGPAPDAAWPAKRVIPVYVTATDTPAAVIGAHLETYDAILGGIRDWYAERAGETFRAEPVRALAGRFTRAQWQDFGRRGFAYPDGTRSDASGACAMFWGTLWELSEGGLLEAAGLPPVGSDGVLYYAIAGGGDNGSCGAAGWLGASEVALLDRARAHCPAGRYVGAASDCAAVGAIAHELGHGFGLPHASDRPACTGGPSLMDVWWEYDRDARLCSEDVADLRGSGWFAPR